MTFIRTQKASKKELSEFRNPFSDFSKEPKWNGAQGQKSRHTSLPTLNQLLMPEGTPSPLFFKTKRIYFNEVSSPKSASPNDNEASGTKDREEISNSGFQFRSRLNTSFSDPASHPMHATPKHLFMNLEPSSKFKPSFKNSKGFANETRPTTGSDSIIHVKLPL